MHVVRGVFCSEVGRTATSQTTGGLLEKGVSGQFTLRIPFSKEERLAALSLANFH